MPYSASQNRATQRYVAKNYEPITLRVKKGEKEKYMKKAEAAGKSLNQYIIDLMEADK